ncbi:MAG TPA: dihydroorotate dehydrogenase electron transfer subunit [Candidatus Saccharicenans sp.]|jgi:dihydroorotate dehydrogenase electron transfer subunit|nr:dihydroorotate dehydrogenase electron transfer subunit [Candidatus Saccharicenans sp.]HRD01872.1 dihydroorotate dehydrogenase electron transfer subunit [Candidatus Saccharicenans sp.]
MFQDKNARIIKTESWGNYFLLRLAAAEIAQKSKPGQFLMIRVSPGLNPLLRRPLSIHDCSGSEVEIFFQVTGKGTELLSQKKPGDHLDVLGPCGGGFSLLPEFKDKEIFCVGGGRGLAPLYFLARELQTAGARPVVFYGGQTLSDLPLKKRLDEAGWETNFSTDDGSFGFHGLVTQLAEKELMKRKPSFLFGCGPEAMMTRLAEICQQAVLPAEFSLESIMGCGLGACWGCSRKIKKNGEIKYLRICQDGPVFPAEEIIWSGD